MKEMKQYAAGFIRDARNIGLAALLVGISFLVSDKHSENKTENPVPAYQATAAYSLLRHQEQKMQRTEPEYRALAIDMQTSTPALTPTQTPTATPPPLIPAEESVNTNDLMRITFYYCGQVPGYPIGDGGGYCGWPVSEDVSGKAAACGNVWEKGTRFFIHGYGEVVCVDRGSMVGNGQLDVYFQTNEEFYNSKLSEIGGWAQVDVIQ